MDRLSVPWMFVGPSGSGKTTTIRRWIEEAHGVKLTYPLEVRTFSVGDGYEARVAASPYHFEIDIPNLSMQDKQIIGELLTMFLSSGDVLNSLRSSTRKLVVLRRAHCLSLPAAIRVKAVLQQYVMPAHASGMVWISTRDVTGPLSLFDSSFVRYRVPRMSLELWKTTVPEPYQTEIAWKQLEGRPERAKAMMAFFPTTADIRWPRRIQDYYDRFLLEVLESAAGKRPPNLDTVQWIRGCVYEALSFCQTGPEILDSCAAALARVFVPGLHPAPLFWRAMAILSKAEPHTSYRTPLALEWALLNMYDVMQKTYAEVKVSNNGGSVESVDLHDDAMDTCADSCGGTAASEVKRKPRSVATSRRKCMG